MEYYTVYDMEDNIIAFLDSIDELHLFSGLRIGDIKYKFKDTNNIVFVKDHKKYKVFRFF